MMVRIVALVACIALGLGARAAADDAIFSTNISGPDVAQLYKALAEIETSDKILLNISSKPASEMPSYDPIAHYVGPIPNGKPHEAALFVSESFDGKNLQHDRALHAALELAVMDSGMAGPKWKQIYDVATAADTKLPPDVPDRYKNRHLVTKVVQDVVDDATASASPKR
jgi:hypothetical protein